MKFWKIYIYFPLIFRQSSNEAKKQEKAKLEKDELTNRLAEMTFRLERQDAQLREMTRVLADIGKYKYKTKFLFNKSYYKTNFIN